MKKKTSLLLVCGWLLLGAAWQNVSAEDSAHNELRALRTKVIDAITKGDFESMVVHLHTNVVVTWQNSEVCRGHQGLREFYKRMGQDAFKGYKVPPTPDELTILHGDDTGISFGHVVGHYKLLGRDYEFKSRWTATLVKENERWLLAGYHVSLNALDNPLFNAAKRAVYWAGGVAAVVGLVVGLWIGKRKRA